MSDIFEGPRRDADHIFWPDYDPRKPTPIDPWFPGRPPAGQRVQIDRPPVELLVGSGALTVTAVVLRFQSDWRLTALGYAAAVAAILLAARFVQASEELRSTSRRFAPYPWAPRATVLAFAAAFAAALLDIWRLAHEIATRYKLFGAVVLAGAALAVGSLTAAGPAAALATPGPAQPPPTDPAVAVYQDFLTCVSDDRTGLVQVIVDESASLQDTDPRDERVQALQSTLQTLDVARRNAGGDLALEVLLAGFAVDYTVRRDWLPLDDTSIADLLGAAADYAERDTGLDTDYYLALEGARASFARRADEIIVAGAPPPCQMLFWITDGLYSVEDRTTASRIRRGGDHKTYAPDLDLTRRGAGAAAVALGTELLCADRGTVDQLRADETSVIAVTLAAGGTPAATYALVEAVATARASDGSTCGTLPARGAVISADEPGRLSITPGSHPIRFPYEFTIDDLVSAFTLEVRGSGRSDLFDAPLSVSLVDPLGRSVTLTRPGSGSFAASEATLGTDHQVRWTWYSTQRVFIETDVAQGRGTGTWTLRMLDDARPDVDLLTFPAYDIALAPDTTLRPGETSALEVRVVGDDGQPLGAGVVDRLDLSAVTGPDGDGTPVDLVPAPGGFVGELTLPLDYDRSVLAVTVDLRPRDPDSSLFPRTRTFEIPVASPAGFPVVGRVRVDNIEGTGTTVVDIEIVGDPSAGGCVTVRDVDIDRLPPSYRSGGVRLGEPPDGCLRIEAGTSRHLTVELTVSEPGRGRIRGTADLELHSDDSQRRVTRTVEFGLSVVPLADRPTEWLMRIVLTVLGVMFPLGVLYTSKIRSARYIGSGRIRMVTVPVVVDSEALAPSPEWTKLGWRGPTTGAWLHEGSREPPRHPSFVFGRRLGLDPFRPGRATVTAPGSLLIVGSGDARSAGDDEAVVAFGLRSSWVVRIDEVRWVDEPVEPPRPPVEPDTLLGYGWSDRPGGNPAHPWRSAGGRRTERSHPWDPRRSESTGNEILSLLRSRPGPPTPPGTDHDADEGTRRGDRRILRGTGTLVAFVGESEELDGILHDAHRKVPHIFAAAPSVREAAGDAPAATPEPPDATGGGTEPPPDDRPPDGGTPARPRPGPSAPPLSEERPEPTDTVPRDPWAF